MKKILIVSFLVTLIDQLIKLFITINLEVNHSIILFKNIFNISYLQNKGAAFSILNSNTFLLIIISVIALLLIYKYFIKDKQLNKTEIFIYSLLLGGIFGNLIDRIFRGYVVDYLDFQIFNFPVFNLADTCIVISVILIMIDMLKGDLNENKSRRK